MGLRYKILGNPQTVEELVQYGIKKGRGHIDIITDKKLKESTFVCGNNEPDKKLKVPAFVWYEGELTLVCGDKEIKLDKVCAGKSTCLGKPGYLDVLRDEEMDRKTLKEAKKKAEYIESQGLKAIIDGNPSE